MASIRLIKECSKQCFKSKISTLYWGMHGVGKSEMVRQLANEIFPLTDEERALGYINFVDVRLGNLEVGDLKGLPLIDAITKAKRMIWALPAFWPTPENAPKGAIVFFDEINRAQPSVLQATFQITLDRKMDDYILPDNCVVCAAANPNTFDYQVNELDTALLSRFVQFMVQPTRQEWIDYQRQKLDEQTKKRGYVNTNMNSIIEFIEGNAGGQGSTILDPKLEERQKEWKMLVEPDRRAVEKFGEIIDGLDVNIPSHADIMKTIGLGMLGTEITASLIKHLSTNEKPLTGEEVLFNYKANKKKFKSYSSNASMKMGIIKASVNNVIDFIHKKLEEKADFVNSTFEEATKKLKGVVNMDGRLVKSEMLNNFIDFLKDCPKEISMATLKGDLLKRSEDSKDAGVSNGLFDVIVYVFSDDEFEKRVTDAVSDVVEKESGFLDK